MAAYFSTEAWVNFKLWGYVFPIVFLVAQGLYISPHLKSGQARRMSLPHRHSDLEARLRDALQPTALEVIDESAAHAGHAGADAEGYGTHFRVRIASPAVRRQAPRGAPSACV